IISRYQYYANLYMLRKIDYDEYLKYEQVVDQLFFINEQVSKTMSEVEKYYQSQQAYFKGILLQEQGFIEEAIESYQEVMFNDQYYYDLAKIQSKECLQMIKEQYLAQAREYYAKKDYLKALERLDYLINIDKDESISALKWYYQAEFYVEIIQEVDSLVANGEIRKALLYLEELTDVFDSQYAETLELKKSELLLQQIHRRDAVMSKYASKIQVNLNAENAQQVISYKKIPLSLETAFNLDSFITNTFTIIKNERDESLEEEQVEQYINVMPFLIANSDLTSAKMLMLFGYYSEVCNDFEQVDLYHGNRLLYSFKIEETQQIQLLDDKVIEWGGVVLEEEVVYNLLSEIDSTTPLHLVFRGPLRNYRFDLAVIEREILVMMADIYQSINK
nr:hypothetical protein [Turicibacter sp.]